MSTTSVDKYYRQIKGVDVKSLGSFPRYEALNYHGEPTGRTFTSLTRAERYDEAVRILRGSLWECMQQIKI